MPFTALRPTLLGALAPAFALLLGLTPQGAHALGVGRPLALSSLGKPLDVFIPVTLADGETLTDSCLRAEVTAGDARVPAGLLQLRLEGETGQQRIHLQSAVRIEEPALRITLALGCPLRLTREFNVLIDPPGGVEAAPPVPVPPPLAALPVAPAPVTTPASAPREAVEGVQAVQAEPRSKPRPRPQAHARPRSSGPRLVMERPEVLVNPAAPRPAATAEPAAELTPELEAQISQLERTVAQLRAELEARQAQPAAEPQAVPSSAAAPADLPASRPTASTPRTAAAPHASPYRDPQIWLMTFALSLLAGSAAFFGSRWFDERARRERAHWRSLQAKAEGAVPPPSPAPAVGIAPPVAAALTAALPDAHANDATRPQPKPMAWPPPQLVTAIPIAEATPVAPTEPAMLSTVPMPVHASAQPQAPHLAIADELLDLQQQVDFLLLLGQHEAAAELLTHRLTRGAGGAMPLLMLMELCQQRGEPEVFAELAQQYAQRFQLPGPDWAQSLARGRGLDLCPSVIAHLQVVWDQPEAAMQMLQDLLAAGGGPGVPGFELPSYRDLLTLYSVARDLYEAGLRGDGVDVMLPIDSRFSGD
ncbi:MAG: hypothetical protein C0460_01895 [Methylibium sp.]|jgi:pilus assembly protein FimV|nr:hypothetical protein [Methylibium sp.]MBY0366006.1 hypothetical protein [Burkholderiaceae bacterium]